MVYKNLGDGKKYLRHYHISILKNKEFRDLDKDKREVVGYLKFSGKKEKATDYDSDTNVFQLDKSSFFEVRDRKPFFSYTRGYIHVDNNKYIELIHGFLPIILIFFTLGTIAILAVFGGISSNNDNNKKPSLNIEDNYNKPDDYDNDGSKGDVEYITINGFDDCTVSSDKKYIELGNSADNDVYLVYKVIDSATDKELYSTDAIEPSKTHYWNAWETLRSYRGSQVKVRLLIQSYDVATQSQTNGAVQDFIITVKG